jgi:hypothetical protein
VGRPRRESGESEPGTREVRVHAVCLGGTRRLDASRAFSTGRSQGLLVNRALARKKSVAPPDAGRGGTEGETVRARRFLSQDTLARPVGLGLQVLDTMEGVLGLLLVPALTGRARRGPLAHRSTPIILKKA